ncbi:MAG: phosphatidylserine decarboxylase [Gemmatimonadales bacterium]|nr:phosphatidylserine decarboxylase [Gemmatimonadales bacterium]
MDIRARYASHFGVAAGYLPPDLEAVAEWHKQIAAELADAEKDGPLADQPSVAALRHLINTDTTVNTLVKAMIKESHGLTGQSFDGPVVWGIANVDTLLSMMNLIITRAPPFEEVKSKRNFFPMSSLFVYMMYTKAGFDAFTNLAFNNAIRVVLQAWCDYLDSPASLSVINHGPTGWLSPDAAKLMDLKDFVIPDPSREDGGFTSFNDFFHREIQLDKRKLAGPHDSKVIVSANDGTIYRIAHDVKPSAQFWLKGQPYSLENMLNGMHVPEFEGGHVFQAFLSGANYHRWRSPVKGTILSQTIVEGLMFSELHAEGFDQSAGTLSQGYQASVNTRGLVFIQADDPTIGLVCVMPIGITEISSISFCRDPKTNPRVEKGDELGWFSYGGSTLCLVFRKEAIKEFLWQWPPPDPKNPPTVQVRGQIAIAN